MTGFGLSEPLAHRYFQDRQVSIRKTEFGLRGGIQPRLGKHEETEVILEVPSSLRRYGIRIKASKEKYKPSKIRKAHFGRNMALIGGFGEGIRNQAMPEIELVRIDRLSKKIVSPTREVPKEISKFLDFITINNYTEYKSRVSELEDVFDRERTFNNNVLPEIDTIRRFALKNRTFPEKSNDLLKKSHELLINYIEVGFNELQKKIKANEIPPMEYEREKMRLFYLKMAIKEDDPRSLKELEKEHQEIRTKAEGLTQKLMGLF